MSTPGLRPILIWAACVLLLPSLALSQAQKRSFLPQDLYQGLRLGDPQVSPDGTRVAFVVRKADTTRQNYLSRVWVAPLDGSSSGVTILEAMNQFRLAPRWSPDGQRIAFLRGDPAQIWTVTISGDNPVQISKMPHGVSDFSWSPDGRQFAFVAEVSDRRANTGIPGYTGKSTAMVITRPDYRAGDWGYRSWSRGADGFYNDDRIPHIFLVSSKGGEPRQITDGDSPEVEPQWSPDGSHLFFVRVGQLWKLNLGSGRITQLTSGGGSIRVPRLSPDGRFIAYLGRPPAVGGYRNDGIFLVPTAGGPWRNLTWNYDRRAGASFFHPPSIGWSSDSKFVYFTAVDRGRVPLLRVDAAGNSRIEPVTSGKNSVDSFTVSPQGRIVYTLAYMTHPNEIWVLDHDGSRQLTHFNDDWLAELALATPREIEFQSFDGRTVQGWILRPPGAPSGAKLPTILDIHGGPHLWFGHDPTWLHLWQSLAARHYMVLFLNPRGSAGYGQQFAGLVQGAWGQGDFRDLMEGVDHVIEKGWADPNRLGVMGLSYGGFMTNWIIGRSDRFGAAISRGGLSDFVSFSGTSDIRGPYGPPGDNLERAVKGSPLVYGVSVKTPTLFSHGETDYRVPITQTEEMYQTLKTFGVPTVMVRWPGQGHIPELLGRPHDRVELVRMFLSWFDHYLLAPQG